MRLSAGILLYRFTGPGRLEVLLGHMGGPFWARKDDHAWSIPKGEHDAGEDPRAAAAREFTEELGAPPPPGPHVDLGTVTQSGGKKVTAFAVHGDFDAEHIQSNTFEIEWPRGSGTLRSFPEIDRAAWFDLEAARSKLVKGQLPFLERLRAAVTPPG
ncbi:NUDIX domain-containing protein [Pseudonocardia acidicola]|uniref:NUDIX domain-containing protein n=1 Tax=Pseudonocardia acidicola TaxID=2724939 RepID=UPI0030843371